MYRIFAAPPAEYQNCVLQDYTILVGMDVVIASNAICMTLYHVAFTHDSTIIAFTMVTLVAGVVIAHAMSGYETYLFVFLLGCCFLIICPVLLRKIYVKLEQMDSEEDTIVKSEKNTSKKNESSARHSSNSRDMSPQQRKDTKEDTENEKSQDDDKEDGCCKCWWKAAKIVFFEHGENGWVFLAGLALASLGGLFILWDFSAFVLQPQQYYRRVSRQYLESVFNSPADVALFEDRGKTMLMFLEGGAHDTSSFTPVPAGLAYEMYEVMDHTYFVNVPYPPVLDDYSQYSVQTPKSSRNSYPHVFWHLFSMLAPFLVILATKPRKGVMCCGRSRAEVMAEKGMNWIGDPQILWDEWRAWREARKAQSSDNGSPKTELGSKNITNSIVHEPSVSSSMVSKEPPSFSSARASNDIELVLTS